MATSSSVSVVETTNTPPLANLTLILFRNLYQRLTPISERHISKALLRNLYHYMTDLSGVELHLGFIIGFKTYKIGLNLFCYTSFLTKNKFTLTVIRDPARQQKVLGENFHPCIKFVDSLEDAHRYLSDMHIQKISVIGGYQTFNEALVTKQSYITNIHEYITAIDEYDRQREKERDLKFDWDRFIITMVENLTQRNGSIGTGYIGSDDPINFRLWERRGG